MAGCGWKVRVQVHLQLHRHPTLMGFAPFPPCGFSKHASDSAKWSMATYLSTYREGNNRVKMVLTLASCAEHNKHSIGARLRIQGRVSRYHVSGTRSYLELDHKEEKTKKMKHEIASISVAPTKRMMPFLPNVPVPSDPRPSLLRESLIITSEVLPNRDKPAATTL